MPSETTETAALATSPSEHVFAFPGDQFIKVAPGSIASNMKFKSRAAAKYNAAIDGLESLLLAMATAGIPMNTPQMNKAVQTAVEAIANHYD
jgi:hypothetical protein